MFRDGKAQAGTSFRARRHFTRIKFAKDVWEHFRSDSLSRVRDAGLNKSLIYGPDFDTDVSSRWRKLAGIVDKVREDLCQLVRIGTDQNGEICPDGVQPETLVSSNGHEIRRQVVDEGPYRKNLWLEVNLSGFDRCKIKEIGDHSNQAPDVAFDPAEIGFLFFRDGASYAIEHVIEKATHCG